MPETMQFIEFLAFAVLVAMLLEEIWMAFHHGYNRPFSRCKRRVYRITHGLNSRVSVSVVATNDGSEVVPSRLTFVTATAFDAEFDGPRRPARVYVFSNRDNKVYSEDIKG